MIVEIGIWRTNDSRGAMQLMKQLEIWYAAGEERLLE